MITTKKTDIFATKAIPIKKNGGTKGSGLEEEKYLQDRLFQWHWYNYIKINLHKLTKFISGNILLKKTVRIYDANIFFSEGDQVDELWRKKIFLKLETKNPGTGRKMEMKLYTE